MRNTARQTRDNRTITVDFHDETTYFTLLDDRKAFVELGDENENYTGIVSAGYGASTHTVG